jgi:fructose-bisphosphate aldolase class II
MQSLREIIADAETRKIAIGHFNAADSIVLRGIFEAARVLNLPVIIGTSEGERSFFGVRQVAAFVRSLREEHDYPIFLNADHTYSFEGVQEAVEAGYDAVIFDGAKLSFEENVRITKQCVEYAKSKNPNILIEGELGYIGQSSKLLDVIPEGVNTDEASLTHPDELERFVRETGVDLVAPAVGNLHGMIKGGGNPRLDIERIRTLREAAGVPLVLHGGSGTSDDDFVAAIEAGISIVHINTELRLAMRQAIALAIQEDPDEIAPYKLFKPALQAVEKLVDARLRLFAR